MNAAKLGLKEVAVHFGAFDHHLFCVVGPHTHLERYVRFRHGDPPFAIDVDPTQANGLFFARRGYSPVIWMPKKPRTPMGYATLAHELMHAIRFIVRDWAGLELNRDTDEAFCHAMGHATRTILEGLR